MLPSSYLPEERVRSDCAFVPSSRRIISSAGSIDTGTGLPPCWCTIWRLKNISEYSFSGVQLDDQQTKWVHDTNWLAQASHSNISLVLLLYILTLRMQDRYGPP